METTKQIPTFSKEETLDICSAIWNKRCREVFNANNDFGSVEIMVDAGMTIQDLYNEASAEEKEIIEECLPIAITLGIDDDGTFVSMSVWAPNSICLYESHILDIEHSKSWLSRITIEDGKKYYRLIADGVSIHAQGKSFDVVESRARGKALAENKYNVSDMFVRDLGNTVIDGSHYNLYESYFDAGSDDYFYFAVKNFEEK